MGKTEKWTQSQTLCATVITGFAHTLSVAMFLTPCIGIGAYYFQAGTIGWIGIFIVSAVYLCTTVVIMLILVYWGMKGAVTFKSAFLEHHEKALTGAVLVALGILA